jgi:hypothetical protein
MKLRKLKLIVMAAAAVIAFAANSAFASYSYDFNIDTTSVAGQTGYMELQFNPGINPGVASAVISNYSSDGTLAGAPQVTGAVTGALPGTVTINNTTGWNDYYQAVMFGNTIHYSLNLSGAAGNSFGLSFYGADGATPLLTNDLTNGYATTIDLNANGAVVTNNSNQVSVAQTPIPAAAWLLGSGLMGLAGIRRRTAA